jgi:hypothetical protein
MTPAEAHELVSRNLPPDLVGRFYFPGNNLAIGKGLVFRDVACPLFEPADQRYVTAEVSAYLLTHECDVDQENDRLFNDSVLVCPILPLQDIVDEYKEAGLEGMLPSFLANLGAKNISRLVFIPPIPEFLDYGGALYLNQITYTDVNALMNGRAQKVCGLTAHGLTHVEYAIEHHLLRPKADRIAFQPPAN